MSSIKKKRKRKRITTHMATVNGRAVLLETFFKAYVEDNELMTERMIVCVGGGVTLRL